MPINKFLYFGDFLTTPLAMILFFSLALWRGGAMARPAPADHIWMITVLVSR